MAASKVQFWKPGTSAPGAGLHIERPQEGEGAGSSVAFNPNISKSMIQQRQSLPVFKHRTSILYCVENYQTVIIVGETGCGKTTQIPQYLLEAGLAAGGRLIGVTQPRRVAATTVATRIAEERGSFIGQEIGYCIRFEECLDPEATQVKFMTDGILVREMMADPLLSKYSVMMLDEVHERTLYSDIIIGLMKKILKKRKDLRLIVSSATMDAEIFQEFFNFNITDDRSKDTTVIMSVEGRTFPVDVFYSRSPLPDYVKSTVESVIEIHKDEPPGDVLAFLTGQEEVENAVAMLRERIPSLPKHLQNVKVLPMYSGLPYSEQLEVFKRTPDKTRKVVFATNIAETSITINGVVYVVDCGFVKLKAYSPKMGIDCLVVVPTSQASAAQRSGRAGRVRSGKAFRLYPESEFHKLRKETIPEMQRSDLAPVLLQLKSMGIDNVLRFDFLSPPPAQTMIQGLELLFALGALDEDGKLTDPLGVNMAEFPLDPMIAKMLLVSGEFGCSEEALSIAAMLQIQNIFMSPSKLKAEAEKCKRKLSVYEGDHLTLLNVYKSFIKNDKSSRWCHQNFFNYKGLCHAFRIRGQLRNLLQNFKIPLVSCKDDDVMLRRCIVAGFFANAARLHPSGVYRTVRDDHALHIHPTSVLYTEKQPQWVVFHEILQTSKEYMRDVCTIEASWLYELAPHYYEFGTERELAAKKAKTS